MKTRFFDFEVFPKWWLCVLGDADFDDKIDESIKDKFTIIHSDMPNARDLLMQQLMDESVCKCGFNIKHYDLIIANAIYQGFIPEQVKIVNDLIISPWDRYKTKEHLRIYPFSTKRLGVKAIQDLRDDMDENVSLKDIEAALGLNILECSIDFNQEELSAADKDDIIYYCKHDVYASMRVFFDVCYDYTKTKVLLGKKFGISEAVCRSNTNPGLTSILLKAVKMTFIDADNSVIELPASIKDYCISNMPQDILQKLLTSKELFSTRLYDNEISYGNGGVHSVYKMPEWKDTVLYIKSDKNWSLINIDASSYYPSMLIMFNCLSRTFSERQRFIDIYNERMYLKSLDKLTPEQDALQAAYKLVLNSTYGASGCKWLPAYDPYQCTKTCRLGQIFLTALCCKLHKSIPGLRVIQMNTDGILVYMPNEYMNVLEACMQEWTNISGISMEKDIVDRIWQRDVNNYLLVKTNGKIKSKGGWLRTTWRNKGTVKVSPLTAYVCAKAVTEYLINGEDILKFIVNHKDITDFAVFCKKGPTFSKVVQKLADGKETQLFKSNRVMSTKNAYYGQIFKIKKLRDKLSYTVMSNIPDHCMLINKDLSEYDFDSMKKGIDYMYYINRCYDLLNYKFIEMYGHITKECTKFNYFNEE